MVHSRSLWRHLCSCHQLLPPQAQGGFRTMGWGRGRNGPACRGSECKSGAGGLPHPPRVRQEPGTVDCCRDGQETGRG
ncbi:hypothetical protein chiPu_0027958 [Chiloscyllium punctatum]|uniref:Uncharacterized protein n=1 Tax=Chiloscyllium punctatum TaxID=137246 RepID=A0A401TMN7_CHIPU|nr:hypothetical protein [Chiloscyllium punctatum]